MHENNKRNATLMEKGKKREKGIKLQQREGAAVIREGEQKIKNKRRIGLKGNRTGSVCYKG